jgi:SAM-dependent methyltransferase
MTWDPIWEKIFSGRSWGKYPPEDLIRFVARNFYKAENRKDVRILEVGCGPGANLWFIAREGFSTYGVEGSATAVAHARERLDQECPGWQGDVLTGDIVDLPFEDGFFDAVIDNEAITHNSFDDSKDIFKEIARVSKPKGKLFSRTFATGCWGDKTGENVGHNAWLVTESPMNLGEYIRFTDYEEIRDLIAPFATTEVELLTRTMEDGKHEIKEWLINAELP